MFACNTAGRITPLVPFTVRVVRRIHAAVKLNAHRTVNTGAARRWPRLNGGSRLQVEVPMTGIRHFRVAAAAVKRAGEAGGVTVWLQSRLFRRHAIAPFNPTPAAVDPHVLAAA